MIGNLNLRGNLGLPGFLLKLFPDNGCGLNTYFEKKNSIETINWAVHTELGTITLHCLIF